MVIMQCVTVILLCLLLIRSINHDDRMERLEKFVGRVVRAAEVKAAYTEDIFSHESIENVEDVEDIEEVIADGEGEDR